MTTTFVHVTAGVVDAIGSPPDTTWADGRWWDLRRRDSEALAACGWHEATLAARPADTATTTWDQTWTLTDGTWREGWTERAKTSEELAAAAVVATEATLKTGTTSQVDTLLAAMIGLQADRATVAATLGTAGTPNWTTWRGIRAQTKATINADPDRESEPEVCQGLDPNGRIGVDRRLGLRAGGNEVAVSVSDFAGRAATGMGGRCRSPYQRDVNPCLKFSHTPSCEARRAPAACRCHTPTRLGNRGNRPTAWTGRRMPRRSEQVRHQAACRAWYSSPGSPVGVEASVRYAASHTPARPRTAVTACIPAEACASVSSPVPTRAAVTARAAA